ILTNNHVITLETASVAPKIQVILSDGRTVEAKVVGRDPGTDLAVLEVSAQNLTPAKFAATGSVEVGQPVLAIGYAFNIAGTPTGGTVIDGVQSGTPAEKAGLRAGDIIVKVGNHDVHNTGDLQQSLIDQPPGTKVTITFFRGSDKKTLDVTLGTRPDLG